LCRFFDKWVWNANIHSHELLLRDGAGAVGGLGRSPARLSLAFVSPSLFPSFILAVRKIVLGKGIVIEAPQHHPKRKNMKLVKLRNWRPHADVPYVKRIHQAVIELLETYRPNLIDNFLNARWIETAMSRQRYSGNKTALIILSPNHIAPATPSQNHMLNQGCKVVQLVRYCPALTALWLLPFDWLGRESAM